MNRLTIPVALCMGIFPAVGQEAIRKWDVELPAKSIGAEPAAAPVKSFPANLEVISSQTKTVEIVETPEIIDLPPVSGKINLTIQQVANPNLPDLPPPLPALPPDDPAVISRLNEMRQNQKDVQLVFISASVYDDKETLIRIYPNGQIEGEIVAWSNLNLLHLTGQGGYRVKHPDGSFQDHGILMGISSMKNELGRRIAASENSEDIKIPQLPSLNASGPAFVVVKGRTDSKAGELLEQIHDLFRVSGETLKEEYLIREKAAAERKAYLIANPPKPQDVKIRFWKRN